MSPAPLKPSRTTIDEYLQHEMAAEERHVFLDGVVWAMAGDSDAHGAVSMNLAILISSQLRGGPCRGRVKETRVRSGPAAPRPFRTTRGMYSYPDLVVFCGEPDFEEPGGTLVNPVAVFEVLSPSTEAFDRGQKFNRLEQWNPTLSDYLLIAQDMPEVEHRTRQPDGSWSLRRVSGLDAVVVIASIQCTLRLADLFERVSFPADPEDA